MQDIEIEIVEIKDDQIETQMLSAYQEGIDAFENQLYIENVHADKNIFNYNIQLLRILYLADEIEFILSLFFDILDFLDFVHFSMFSMSSMSSICEV